MMITRNPIYSACLCLSLMLLSPVWGQKKETEPAKEPADPFLKGTSARTARPPQASEEKATYHNVGFR